MNLDVLFGASNLIVAAVTAVVALASPFLAWRLTRRSQREDNKRRDKLNIFGILMEYRHALQSRDTVRALNLIDVAFHDNADVRRIWREYHGMISNNAFFRSEVGYELVKQKLVELQAAIARDLGYSIDQFDIQRIYAPTWLRDEENIEIGERRERLNRLVQSHTPTGQHALSASVPSAPHVGGFYLTRYQGQDGSEGIGTLYLGDGKMSGTDVAGGRYGGTFQIEGDKVRINGLLIVGPGMRLVTGLVVEAETSIPIVAELPIDFANGAKHTILVAEQPVSVTFEKVQ